MTVLRSIALFVLAAIAEIGGAYLVWQGIRERRGILFVGAGVIALGLYGFFATFQPSPHFGRILAAYGGVFVAGSLTWGVVFDGFQPDRYDIIGALICLIGVAVIMYAPLPGCEASTGSTGTPRLGHTRNEYAQKGWAPRFVPGYFACHDCVPPRLAGTSNA